MNYTLLEAIILHNDENPSIDIVGLFSSKEKIDEAKKAHLEEWDIELPLEYGRFRWKLTKLTVDEIRL